MCSIPVQQPGQAVVDPAPGGDARVQFRQLRPQQGGDQSGHAHGEVRRLVLVALEDLFRRPGPVLGVEHVAAGMQDRLGGQVGIVGRQQAALAGVDVLEGLGAEAGDHAEGAAQPAVPARAHGVGAVLDQQQVVAPADLQQAVHVGDVAAHVGQQQDPRAGLGGLAVQVLQVDVIGLGDLDQHRLRARVGDGPRHRRQGEGIDQHLVAGCDTRRLERDEKRAAAGVEPDHVAHAQVRGELLFQQRGLGQAVAVLAVAEQPAVPEQPFGGRDRRLGQGVRGAEVLGEDRAVAAPRQVCGLEAQDTLPFCRSKSSPGKYLARRTSPVMAWPSMPSRREIREATGATARVASRVMR